MDSPGGYYDPVTGQPMGYDPATGQPFYGEQVQNPYGGQSSPGGPQYGMPGPSGGQPEYSPFSDTSQSIMAPSGSFERRPSQTGVAWDESNIKRTLHPIDKDYGFMRCDEPKTPFSYGFIPNDPRSRLDYQNLVERMRQHQQHVQEMQRAAAPAAAPPPGPGDYHPPPRDPNWAS
ncbi:uncharacterized protein LOC135371001 [Ornithodoros turicata]|uniref:uncharacterized protein LOC135371001 n=1 Tax=Ornithodoros turicata TaxID=34597 RepID=UPI0031394F4E